jgi:hypothetical protein
MLPPLAHETELRSLTFWQDDDGICRGRARVGHDEDLDGAMALVALLRRVGRGAPLPLLMDIREGRSITREARAYLAGEEAQAVVQAGALLVSSGVSSVIGNFFIRLARPRVPTRLFTDEGEAIAWLRQHAR